MILYDSGMICVYKHFSRSVNVFYEQKEELVVGFFFTFISRMIHLIGCSYLGL